VGSAALRPTSLRHDVQMRERFGGIAPNEAFVLSANEGAVIPAQPPGSAVTVKVGGSFLHCPVTAAEGAFDPRQEAPQWTGRHRHHQFTEMCYVLEGDMKFLVGEVTHRVEAGGFVCILPETVHAYVPSRERIAKALFISIPGGFEGMFEEAAQMQPHVNPGVFWRDLNERYDTEPVGPPREG
jgi:mannose-6-phosphate isomerase-like protein (cupin superfamily)